MDNKVFILLDSSGSMFNQWNEAIKSINTYVSSLKENTSADVYVAAFDTTRGYRVVRNTCTSKWEPISTSEITPGGGTQLLDAAGRIMWAMEDSLAKNAVLVIMTDGEENSSMKFCKEEVVGLLSDLTSKKGYDVSFLGANFDKINTVAQSTFGWKDSTRVAYTTTQNLGAAMCSSALVASQYFNTGVKVDAVYSDADKARWAENKNS